MTPQTKFGLIGKSLKHSFSAEIHALLGNDDYRLLPLDEEEVDEFMRRAEFSGINVTIPYKQTVIPYLDDLDPHARAIGAVNTVIRKGDKLIGYNTDFYGLQALIDALDLQVSGKKVLILGSGGTSKTARELGRHLHARAVIRVSRTPGEDSCSYEQAMTLHQDAEIIINTTPVGMYPDRIGQSPIDLAPFQKLEGLVDTVYNPLRTQLVLEAQKRKVPASGGLFMLIMQAHYAAEFFMNQKIDRKKSEAIFLSLLRRKENIVLTGMPGSGKSTLGRILAQKLNRPFHDTDDLIVSDRGRTIPQIFEEEGEAGFRDRESEVIRSLTEASGAVIATGGGSVLRPENVDALKANGRLFLIDRPLESLIPSSDRPLSSNRGDLEKKYRERKDLYRSTADRILTTNAGPEETAELILKEYR